MADILELAKDIHPNISISKDNLSNRYVEIHKKKKKEIDWYINLNHNSAPLFLSGVVGVGKTTLLKNLNIENSIYINIENFSNKYEVIVKVLKKLKIDIGIDEFESTSLNEFKKLIDKKIDRVSYKLIMIDGLDKFFEKSDLELISKIVFDFSFIWKALNTNIIFTLPIQFCIETKLIREYERIYGVDAIDDNYHIILATPNVEKANHKFWINFIRKRTNLDENIITNKEILEILEYSGGIFKTTLMLLFNILKEVYKNGDTRIKDKYIEFIGHKYLNKIEEDVKINFEKLKEISEHPHNYTIPESFEYLFLRDIPLVVYYKFEDRYEYKLHPKISL